MTDVLDTSVKTVSGGDMPAWVALPAAGHEPTPAVLVIHEIVGLHENIKPILIRFAQEGYAVIAPDLFAQSASRARCVVRTLADMRAGHGETVENLRAAARALTEYPGVSPDRLGVAGFCMGGGFALIMALDDSFKASAPFYGSSPAYYERAAESCPVVASFGGRDLVFRKEARRLQACLRDVGVEHDFEMYPNAGHSFMTSDLGGWMGAAAPYTPLRVGYDPDSAEDAWRRMLAFFRRFV